MGFLLFLKFVARNFDVLAWPLITLVYPLYASIQAIERNSLSDSKKCLTYWVISGLIMLFEVPFAGIVHWIPFWPYVRLMFNFWFVMAHFEGAVYAYERFIRPCFSVDLQKIGYWLRPKCKEFGTGNSDEFLLLAKRFVEENGSDGLEKLISEKVECEKTKLALGENNLVQSENIKENTDRNRVELIDKSIVQAGYKSIAATENKPIAEAKVIVESSEVPHPSIALGENNLVQSENIKENTDRNRVELIDTSIVQAGYKSIAVTENKPTAEAKVVVQSSEVPQPSIAGNTQKEWTCAVCQVCASSEIALQQHLKGRRHKAREETIKKSTGTETKVKQRPFKTPKEELLSAKSVAADVTETESSVPGEPPKKWRCDLCEIYTSKETVIQDHLRGKKHKAKEMEFSAKHMVDINTTSPFVKVSDLWCEKCKLQCNSLSMLADHLRGKRHHVGSVSTL